MHGLKRRGLETERKPPRQSPTLLREGCRRGPGFWEGAVPRGVGRCGGWGVEPSWIAQWWSWTPMSASRRRRWRTRLAWSMSRWPASIWMGVRAVAKGMPARLVVHHRRPAERAPAARLRLRLREPRGDPAGEMAGDEHLVRVLVPHDGDRRGGRAVGLYREPASSPASFSVLAFSASSPTRLTSTSVAPASAYARIAAATVSSSPATIVSATLLCPWRSRSVR
jgi:hypothetical protein